MKIHFRLNFQDHFNEVVKLFLFLIPLPFFSFSQEVLFYKNNKIQEVNLLQSTKDSLKYIPLDNLDGPIYTVKKEDVQFVLLKDLTSIRADIKDTIDTLNYLKMISFLGERNAEKYYRGYKKFQGSIIFCSILGTPVLGAVPFLIGRNKNLEQTEVKANHDFLLTYLVYKNAYLEKVKKMQKKKLKGAYIVGSSVFGYAGLVVTFFAYIYSQFVFFA